MGSQDKCSELTVGDILIHSTAGPVSDVRLESEGFRSASMAVWRIQVSLCYAHSAA